MWQAQRSHQEIVIGIFILFSKFLDYWLLFDHASDFVYLVSIQSSEWVELNCINHNKSPYKHRFIAGFSKCMTKDLSCLLTKLLSTIKDGLMSYCNTKMWILKNSTNVLSSLDQLEVHTATSVQTFDFLTLYTSIPHDPLKPCTQCFQSERSVRHTHVKVTRAKSYFAHDINGGKDNIYTTDNIGKMIEFLIDNIFVQFGGCLSRQVIGIPVGTNCVLHYLLTFSFTHMRMNV